MRILAVANRYPPWSRGGYEVMAAGAAEALRRAGHEVQVLTTVPDPSDRPAAGEPAPDVHRELRWYWRDHRFPSIALRGTVSLERENARVLSRHLNQFRPDVVLWWSMGGMSLSLLAQVRRAAVPAVGVVGDDWMIYARDVDAWTRRWCGWRALGAPIAEHVTGVPARVDLARAGRWVFISEHLRSQARTAGLGSAETIVAHPGVDPNRFPRRPPGPWRWQLLHCGRIDRRKGIATAIDSLGKLPSEAHLTVDGDGDREHAAELSGFADRRGFGARVHFQCSAHDDVPGVYAAADAVLFPVTWQEPWGLVPLEAMAVGRPVVASRAGGGAAEYLRDGDNCLQFPPGDAEALAGALRRLAADPELRSNLIARGLETAARLTDRRFNGALERELERAVFEVTAGGLGGVRSRT